MQHNKARSRRLSVGDVERRAAQAHTVWASIKQVRAARAREMNDGAIMETGGNVMLSSAEAAGMCGRSGVAREVLALSAVHTDAQTARQRHLRIFRLRVAPTAQSNSVTIAKWLDACP